ncbi:MAG: DUF4340 domain-containing protein [Proteobacteria bacterium]|nr:DUF4340 domain-containing protein [Pseudomonadota bacterium]
MKVFIKPLIFIAVLLGLSAIAYWDEITVKKEAKLSEAKTKLFTFNPDEVVKLGFKRLNDQGQQIDLKMEKLDSRWNLTEPMKYPGDAEGVQRLIKTVQDARFEKSFDVAAEKLKDFGLDQPKVTLSLTDQAGHQTGILLGNKSPTGYSSYMKIEGDPKVYLVSQYLVTATSKELQDFRDRSLRLPAFSEAKAIAYQYENEPILTLSRIEEDWIIESPQKFMADANEVKALFGFFERQKIDKFIDSPSPVLQKALSGGNGGTRKLASLVITRKDGGISTYSLLENNEQIYTSLPAYDGIVVLDKKIKEGLKKSVKDLQYRNMFSFNATEALELDADGKVYTKKGEHWLTKETQEDADFIRLLLVDFEFAKADQVITKEEAAKKSVGAPLHIVKISFKDGKKIEFSIWKLGSEPAAGLLVTTNENGYFLANQQLLDNFTAKPKTSAKAGLGNEG